MTSQRKKKKATRKPNPKAVRRADWIETLIVQAANDAVGEFEFDVGLTLEQQTLLVHIVEKHMTSLVQDAREVTTPSNDPTKANKNAVSPDERKCIVADGSRIYGRMLAEKPGKNISLGAVAREMELMYAGDAERPDKEKRSHRTISSVLTEAGWPPKD